MNLANVKFGSNGATIYVGRAATVHNPLFQRLYHRAEYLNRKVSIGQLLQHISKSIVNHCGLCTVKA